MIGFKNHDSRKKKKNGEKQWWRLRHKTDPQVVGFDGTAEGNFQACALRHFWAILLPATVVKVAVAICFKSLLSLVSKNNMKAILGMPFSVTTFFLTEANHVSSTVLKNQKALSSQSFTWYKEFTSFKMIISFVCLVPVPTYVGTFNYFRYRFLV